MNKMTVNRSQEYLISILQELRKLPVETEWLEFKHNNDNPEEIGQYLSALANSAALLGKVNAYMIWGIENQSHEIRGTNFRPAHLRVGNEQLENWLLRLLAPKINFHFHELSVENNVVVLLEIGAAFRHPVQFKSTEYIRIGSYKKKLKDYPEIERELWRVFDHTVFEREIASENVSSEDVLRVLDYPSLFELLRLPLPESRDGILEGFLTEEMILRNQSGKWDITNLGALLFAKKLTDFRTLKRKAVRVILYKNETRVETIREQEGVKGYACGFEGLIASIVNLLPSNEVIGQALRRVFPMFPELAIRELVANAIIHQDFHISGTAPLVEIFSKRIEITNPGIALVNVDRFLDSPPRSRNEVLASFMRRIGICEERGSGVDKIVIQTEIFQLPAPIFETTDEHTRAILFAHRELREMDKNLRAHACYMHACLRYVQRDFMTNTTLRERFGIDDKNSAIASRIIRDTLMAELIRCYDDSVGSKARKYLPWWA